MTSGTGEYVSEPFQSIVISLKVRECVCHVTVCVRGRNATVVERCRGKEEKGLCCGKLAMPESYGRLGVLAWDLFSVKIFWLCAINSWLIEATSIADNHTPWAYALMHACYHPSEGDTGVQRVMSTGVAHV